MESSTVTMVSIVSIVSVTMVIESIASSISAVVGTAATTTSATAPAIIEIVASTIAIISFSIPIAASHFHLLSTILFSLALLFVAFLLPLFVHFFDRFTQS